MDRYRVDDPGLADILGALGLGEPEPDARRCPHCGVVLVEASSRCTRASCRMKIAALNEAGRIAEAEIDHLTSIVEPIEAGGGDHDDAE
jgi:hypothetical protein